MASAFHQYSFAIIFRWIKCYPLLRLVAEIFTLEKMSIPLLGRSSVTLWSPLHISRFVLEEESDPKIYLDLKILVNNINKTQRFINMDQQSGELLFAEIFKWMTLPLSDCLSAPPSVFLLLLVSQYSFLKKCLSKIKNTLILENTFLLNVYLHGKENTNNNNSTSWRVLCESRKICRRKSVSIARLQWYSHHERAYHGHLGFRTGHGQT